MREQGLLLGVYGDSGGLLLLGSSQWGGLPGIACALSVPTNVRQ